MKLSPSFFAASDSSPAETGDAQPTQTGDAAKAAATGKAEASSKQADTAKSGTTKAAKTGSKKTTAAATKTTSVDARLPPGGVNMITPSALAQTSYYKVGDDVTFAWNYTSLSVKPSKIDVYVSCQANSATYTISNNATFEPTGKVVWDTKPEASGTAPLLTETYTLVIHDASKDITAIPVAGHLGAYNQFQFGMYTPQPYTPLSEGWRCATCSGAMSSVDMQALKFMLGMCMITPISNMPSSSTQPAQWTSSMKSFLKRALANGEDNKSAIILLETEYPKMVGKVGEKWVEKVRRGEA
ncbi:MAG: hypothetical protein Q9222_006539 [Ikaeria aurantiellina]